MVIISRNQLTRDGKRTQMSVRDWINPNDIFLRQGGGATSGTLQVRRNGRSCSVSFCDSQISGAVPLAWTKKQENFACRNICLKQPDPNDLSTIKRLCPTIEVLNDEWQDDSRVLHDTFDQCILNSGDSCASGLPASQRGQVGTREECYDYMNGKANWTGPDKTSMDFITFREFINKDGDFDTECKSFLVADQKDPDKIQIIRDNKWKPDPRETTIESSAFERTKIVQSTLDRVVRRAGQATSAFPRTTTDPEIYTPKGTASTENDFPDHVLSAFNNERGDYYNTDTYCVYPDDGILSYEQALATTDKDGVGPHEDLLLNYCFSPETDKSLLQLGLDSAPKALSEARNTMEKAPRDICTDFFSKTASRKEKYDARARRYCNDVLAANRDNPNFNYIRTGCQCILDQSAETDHEQYGPGLNAIRDLPGLDQGAWCIWNSCPGPRESDFNLNFFSDKDKECIETPSCLSLLVITDSNIPYANIVQNTNCTGDKCPECDDELVCDEGGTTNYECVPDCGDSECPSGLICDNDGVCRLPEHTKPTESKTNSTTIIIIVVVVVSVIILGWGVLKFTKKSAPASNVSGGAE